MGHNNNFVVEFQGLKKVYWQARKLIGNWLHSGMANLVF